MSDVAIPRSGDAPTHLLPRDATYASVTQEVVDAVSAAPGRYWWVGFGVKFLYSRW